MDHPLYVHILWHMHQPYYKDLNSGQYLMPWVRLHGTKDYLDMALLAAEHPGVKVTFNYVPSLLEQLLDYAAGTARDPYLNLALARAEDLDENDRIRILQMFFTCNAEQMIKPYPRYQQLLDRRGLSGETADLRRRVQLFTPADLRDIVTWFYLAWIDPSLRRADERLSALERKGRMFSEQEKQLVLEIGREIIGRIVPTLRELWAAGRIELSTTPYFHPILPLLIDTDFARRSRPKVGLPTLRFRHPEDAQRQIDKGLAFCEELFGRRPAGVWPSEGSVCPELTPMLACAGVRWFASDEDVLAQSLGIEHFTRDRAGVPERAADLYRPYIVRHEGAEAAIFFRDHLLSDLIGFKYAHWNPAEAAADLVRRLDEIEKSLGVPPLAGYPAKAGGLQPPHIVSIILDGENCWEHYESDGVPFLRALYKGLAEHPRLKTITPADFLDLFPDQRHLERLHTGSWINHDFAIWIGHPEDNAAWDLLTQARQDVGSRLASDKLDPAAREKAQKSILIAEGSDWNWWYGDDHTSPFDDEFDSLYRQHLVNAYTAVDLEPSGRLFIPIGTQKVRGFQTLPTAFIEPTIDGRVTNYFEWFSAGHYDPRRGGDAMHAAEPIVEGLYYGFGRNIFYLRVDLSKPFIAGGSLAGVELIVHLFTQQNYQVQIPLEQGRRVARIFMEQPGQGWTEEGELHDFAVGSIIEIAFPQKKFQIVSSTTMRVQAAIEVDGREIERCPGRAPLPLSVPTPDFEEIMWIV